MQSQENNFEMQNDELLQNERTELNTKTKLQEQIVHLQSRYASIGQLTGNIAHQWKQPLNAIGSIQTSIKAALLYQENLSKEMLLESVDTSFILLEHLAETIDTFYCFLSQSNSNKTHFNIADELETIRKITEYSFYNSNIKLIYELHSNPIIHGNGNEFTHAMLNLILNAKDALDNFNPPQPAITVRIKDGEKNCAISVTDNAGGIQIEPIESIFESHISSKEKDSGVGLFMSKNIIEKRFGGTISVKNIQEGACFTITLPYEECGEHYADIATPDERLSLERINQLSRKVIELEEVGKNLQKWADIFKNAHWGIAIHLGTSNTFDLFNDVFHTLYGYTKEEFKNLSVPDLFTPEALPILSIIQKEAFEQGHVAFESLLKRKDGSTFPASIELIVIKDDDGEILYHIANVWDISDNKAAEEMLIRTKSALDHIKDAVYMVDENGAFYYVNEGSCHALGYSREELLNMYVGDIDPNWPQERWSENFELLKIEKNILVESQHLRRDGSIFPIELSANYFEYNRISYIVAIAKDITERKLLEQQKDNERMRLFFERQLVGMAITSPAKGWLNTNEKLQKMLGYTQEELSKLTWAELTYPEDLPSNVAEFNRLLAGNIEEYVLEKRFIRKDGTIVYTNLSVSCIRNDDRSINYIIALIEDITEQKIAHDALATKERQFRTLVENLPDNIIRYDKECRAIYVTPLMERIYGVEAVARLIGKTPIEADQDTPSKYQHALEQVIATGEKVEITIEVPLALGEVQYHQIRFIAEHDQNGEICGALAIGTDITERIGAKAF
jgi:PAS domain S-box-containing protein